MISDARKDKGEEKGEEDKKKGWMKEGGIKY